MQFVILVFAVALLIVAVAAPTNAVEMPDPRPSIQSL